METSVWLFYLRILEAEPEFFFTNFLGKIIFQIPPWNQFIYCSCISKVRLKNKQPPSPPPPPTHTHPEDQMVDP